MSRSASPTTESSGRRQCAARRKVSNMSSITEFLNSIALAPYAARFVEQGIDALEDLRYERDLDGLLEDVGLAGADADAFRKALKQALAGDGGETTKSKTSAKDDLAAAVKASLANSRARQGLAESSSERGGGGGMRPSGPRHGDAPPPMRADVDVMSDVNARMGLATGTEIEMILSAHAKRDFLTLLSLREVPIDALGKVEWAGHEAMKVNEIAMRCKVLSLRLDSSRNSHPKAPLAARAVHNALELMSNKETRRVILTEAVRRKVDELRASGATSLEGGYVTLTGIHFGAGATASRTQEENYVSKDLTSELPTYDASIHHDNAVVAIDDGSHARADTKKSSAPPMDVSSIRAKLAAKSKKPRFM